MDLAASAALTLDANAARNAARDANAVRNGGEVGEAGAVNSFLHFILIYSAWNNRTTTVDD